MTLLRRGLCKPRGTSVTGAVRPRAATYNAAAPLITPTYDGSGETTHCDVVDFGTPWNGWRYWLAHTPFPASNNDFENPSILVSSDGLTWQEPAGITNPVTALPNDPASYHSDTDLMYDATSGRLYLFYRYYDALSANNRYQTWVCYSTNGTTWTGHQQVIVANNVHYRLSPAVILENGVWRMWVVERAGNPNTVELYTTTNPFSWPDRSQAVTCTVPIPVANREAWHLDVIKHQGVYYMTLDCTDLDVDGSATAIHLATSLDGIKWNVSEALVPPTASGFDSQDVYRGSILIVGQTIRLWYSAKSKFNAWRVGYTEIPLSEAPVPG